VVTILALPHTIPMAVPIGFALGVVVALGGRGVSRRSMRVVLRLALVGTVASFAMMVWGVPAVNTAFQRTVFERRVRGANELTLFELRERAWPSPHAPIPRPWTFGRSDLGYLARSYYARWAMSCATFVLGLLGLAVLHRGRFVRIAVTIVAGIAYFYACCLTTSLPSEDIALPAVAVAWLPNLAIVTAAGAMVLIRSRRAA
jgi:lipopolysaccharide export LptBFGC system permease protein LptF